MEIKKFCVTKFEKIIFVKTIWNDCEILLLRNIITTEILLLLLTSQLFLNYSSKLSKEKMWNN